MMAESTWETLALPILNHLASIEDEESQSGVLDSDTLAEALGQPVQRVDNELVRLYDSGYLRGNLQHAGMGSRRHHLVAPGISEEGSPDCREVATKRPYELLLRLVEQRISSASTSEERSRWQRFRDGLVDVGKSGAGGLVVELTKAATGLNA